MNKDSPVPVRWQGRSTTEVVMGSTPRKYTHQLGHEVHFISGYYEIVKEGTLLCHGKKVLYAVGNAVVENACCGAGGCRFALVPGYVVGWQLETSHDGLPVSQVEPVRDPSAREEIRQRLQQEEFVTQVDFW